jgi:hypothetical protein
MPILCNSFKSLVLGEQVVESFECQMSDKLKKITNNGSAIIAFYIVTTMLNKATVQDELNL